MIETFGQLLEQLATYGSPEAHLPFEVYDANSGSKMHAVELYSDSEGIFLDVVRADD